MLTIKNIGKIVGMYANGRYIIEAGDYYDHLRKDGKDFFVFKIEKQHDGSEYNDEFDIVLSKARNQNGNYRMFVMGIQRATEVEVSDDYIKSPVELVLAIRNVLVKAQTYYQTS